MLSDMLGFAMLLGGGYGLSEAMKWLVRSALAKFHPQRITQLQILLVLAEGEGYAIEVATKMKNVGVGPRHLRWLRTKMLLEQMYRDGFVYVWQDYGSDRYGLSPDGHALVKATREKLDSLAR